MHNSIRNEAQAKKKVFKSVLESPFAVKWPAVSNELGQSLLSILTQLFEPIGTYRKANPKKHDYPELNKRLVLGINSVTELLEKPAKGWTVFVCKRDIQPTHLCSHLLTMASIAKVKLVPLPQNAQVQLSTALYLPRVSAFALQIQETEERLRLAVEEVPGINAPWLEDVAKGIYQPTKIKVLQTTAPVKPPKNKQQPDKQQQPSKQQQPNKQQQPDKQQQPNKQQQSNKQQQPNKQQQSNKQQKRNAQDANSGSSQPSKKIKR